jgi:hypothetical protein
VTSTVTASKLELMRQQISDWEAEHQETIAEIDRLNTQENIALRDAFLEDPTQKITGATTVVGGIQDKIRRLEGRRNQLYKLLEAARPAYEQERQADAERRNAGLIRNADKAINNAFDGLDARMDDLLAWWEQHCLSAVEQADRCAAYTPTRPVFASLLAFLSERAQAAHRPHITRLVGLPGYRAHGAGSWGQPIHGTASVPDGWSVATGFGNGGAFPIVQQGERENAGQEDRLAAAAAQIINDVAM